MRFRSVLVAAVAASAIAAPALAHRQWLLPSATTLADTGQWVTVDGAISNDLFYPDHFPMRTEQVTVRAPDGAEGKIENASTGRYRSTFDVKVDKPGTWVIGTESASVMGSFKVGAEQWRVGGRRGPPPGAQAGGQPAGQPAGSMSKSVATPAEIPANATDVKLTEVSARNVVFVTAGEPTTTALAPIGKGLEFQPVTHPTSLVADEPGEFRFLVDGKPSAGVKVTVVPGGKKFRASEGAQELTTAADGSVKVSWPVPGFYWMSATITDNRATTPRATERRMTFTTTLEVPAP